MNEARIALAGSAARWAGGARLARLMTPRDNLRIALSHAVFEENMERFEQILRFLSGERRPITPAEFFAHFRNGGSGRMQGRSFLYTFDDGLRSSFDAAQRVLTPLGIKAIFFIPTAILDLGTPREMQRFAWERIYHCTRPLNSLRPEEYLTMTADQILELHRDGHMIFPHTHLHTNISEIKTSADVERELRNPKKILETLLEAEADSFAFPVGTERVLSAYSYRQVARIYSYCFSALMGANTEATNPLLFHRDSIHPWYSLAHVRNIVDGVYDPYYRLKAYKLRRSVDLPQGVAGFAPEPSRPKESRPAGSSPWRGRFIDTVTNELNAAGAEYVLLHGWEPDHDADSDLDIAVDRKGVRLVDTLIRFGVFGPLVQCFHYADPWSRYYVVAVNEPGRRYRQLDVVCDPWGIGRDGPAVPAALAHATSVDAMRVPTPAAQTLYLGVKKARKQMHDARDRAILLASYARDPRGSAELLEQHFGASGVALARALEAEAPDLGVELESLRRTLERRRRSPIALARRAFFAPRRIAGRLMRPTGLVLCVTGPDGAGKSTLADGIEGVSGAFRRTRRFHLSPGLLPPPRRLLRRPPSDTRAPHARSASSPFLSLLRVLYLWIDNLFGWWLKIAPAARRSGLVIVERGWLDLVVDPLRYRLSSDARIARWLGRLLPKPDLVLQLEAEPSEIRSRKPELSTEEIQRQLSAWRLLGASDRGRFRRIDSSRHEAATREQALAAIDSTLASRQREFNSCELALRCLGGLRVRGKPYTIISASRGSARRAPRWLLPAGVGAPGPRGTRLYRPARPRHYIGAFGLELLQRAGVGGLGHTITLDPEHGIGPLIADALGTGPVKLAAAVTGDLRRGQRVLLSVWERNHVVAFAKVAREEASKLEREKRVLDLLAGGDLTELVVPEVAAFLYWDDCAVLLLKPFRVRHRADRPLGRAELSGLAEVARLTERLRPLVGQGDGGTIVHGDFAPWNCAPLSSSALALWDWEETRLGLPLEDLFHWRMQRLLRFGHGSVAELVTAAIEPDAEVRALCSLQGVDPGVAPAALRACLQRTLGAPSMAIEPPPPATYVLREASASLAAAGV